jgi:hypothetical protein
VKIPEGSVSGIEFLDEFPAMVRKLLVVYICLAFTYAFASAADFLTYTGTVNGEPATFSLCWVKPDAVVGTFVRNSQTFTLAGDNSTADEIFMSVAYKGRTVAYLKVHKQGEEWHGSMRIEKNGRIVLVSFSSASSSPRWVDLQAQDCATEHSLRSIDGSIQTSILLVSTISQMTSCKTQWESSPQKLAA